MATNTVIDAINQIASSARVRLAMLMGAKLESGWNPGAVGDNGASFGAFQIHLPAHPNVTAEQAKDPVFATRFMLPAYENAVNRVDAALWNANPARAAALAAFYAERPRNMYPQNRIDAAWPAVNSAWTNAGVPAGTSNGTTDSLTNIPSLSTAWDTIWTGISWFVFDQFGNIIDRIYFVMLIGGGGVTVVVGAYLLLKDARRTTEIATAIVQGYASLGKAGIAASQNMRGKE